MTDHPQGVVPVITVVGLGPAGLDMITAEAAEILRTAASTFAPVFFRTRQHPAAAELLTAGAAGDSPQTFDDVYAAEETFDAVYESIVAALLATAKTTAKATATASASLGVVYAVPGSPFVAERTVELLRERAGTSGVRLEVVPGLSFCDLAWARLGIDPMSAGVRLVDGTSFVRAAAADPGPLLVGQCWSKEVLSDVKLSIEEPAPDQRAVILHHLGLSDEQIVEVAWEDLDRVLEPDHLTSVYIEHLASPVAGEIVRLIETIATLRLQCPWDQEQTHQSLVRHLLEETYEVIEALEGLGTDPTGASPERVAHAEEELGDLLCQVVFHSTLAREEGLFELADVARTLNEKLIRRHPHVFGDGVATTAADVVTSWEQIKRDEKRREHLLDGIPAAMPSLARAATVERKLASVGLGSTSEAAVEATVEATVEAAAEAAAEPTDRGEVILALARALAAAGEDPEGAVRGALDRLVARVAELEAAAAARGLQLGDLTPAELQNWLAKSAEPPAVPPS